VFQIKVDLFQPSNPPSYLGQILAEAISLSRDFHICPMLSPDAFDGPLAHHLQLAPGKRRLDGLFRLTVLVAG